MSAIPAKLIKLKILSQVPVSEYADIRPPTDPSNQAQRAGFFKLLRQKPKSQASKSSIGNASKDKNLSFNAAVWLNFPNPHSKPVSLWLCYKDATGENTILVDEQVLNASKSAMLSGTVHFRVKGQIESLRASCGGVAVDEIFHVEELYVRRLRDRDSAGVINTDFSNLMVS